MLQLAFSGCAFECLHCVDLRCDCGNIISLDTDDFSEVKSDYVVIKSNIPITCEKCGRTYHLKSGRISKEPQANIKPKTTPQTISTEQLLNAVIYN